VLEQIRQQNSFIEALASINSDLHTIQMFHTDRGDLTIHLISNAAFGIRLIVEHEGLSYDNAVATSVSVFQAGIRKWCTFFSWNSSVLIDIVQFSVDNPVYFRKVNYEHQIA